MDKVVVMLRILSNSFVNKLRRWRSNEKMRILTEGKMLMGNNLK